MPYKNPTPEQREKMRHWSREWARRNKDYPRPQRQTQEGRKQERARNRLRKFRLTELDLLKMWTAQHGACAICCTTIENELAGCIDHDHTTGAVRGILCNGCNSGLGMFRESTEALARAIAYLETHRR